MVFGHGMMNSYLYADISYDENPEIYLFYLQNIKNNTSNQSYKAKYKHQDIMILTIITCRKPILHLQMPFSITSSRV